MITMQPTLSAGEIVLICVIVLFVLIAWRGIKIVPQSQEYVIEQFGKYTRTLKPGLNFITPIIHYVSHKVSILERQLSPLNILVITKDNVQIHLDTAIFFRITDAAKSVYRIHDVDKAVDTTVMSVVRATGGQMEFDEVQSKRDIFNHKIQDALVETCSVWGIEITRTEVLDVRVDDSTRGAMQQQLNSERERRASVTKAEGDRQAQQLRADAELYTAQKQAEAKRILADAEAYSTTTVGKAIQENGQPAVDFEIRKQQIISMAELGKSSNTKLVVIPTDITRSLGSLITLVEGLRG
jgi:regulator of protease activity HflC (stomatin/prohibitin superfamily)